MKSQKKNSMKYLQDVEGIEPKIAYHYTSVGAMFDIVRNQVFWLTNLKSSNDKKELYYSDNDFFADYDNLVQHESDEKKKAVLVDIKENTDNRRLFHDAKERDEIYALSLCRKRDNLTHWDRYAGGSSGVCIALNVAAIPQYHERTNMGFFLSSLLDVNQITYHQEERRKLIGALLDDVMDELTRHTRLTYIDFRSMILPLTYYRAKNYVKNSSFSDEQEVRLLYNSRSLATIRKMIREIASKISTDFYKEIREECENVVKSLGIEEKRYALFQNGIRSYHSVCLSEIWGDGLVPEIILGPMCRQDKKELRSFLNSYGLRGTKILESNVPIR